MGYGLFGTGGISMGGNINYGGLNYGNIYEPVKSAKSSSSSKVKKSKVKSSKLEKESRTSTEYDELYNKYKILKKENICLREENSEVYEKLYDLKANIRNNYVPINNHRMLMVFFGITAILLLYVSAML